MRTAQEILEDLVTAKDDAENDPLYNLNEGVHMTRINELFTEARKLCVTQDT